MVEVGGALDPVEAVAMMVQMLVVVLLFHQIASPLPLVELVLFSFLPRNQEVVALLFSSPAKEGLGLESFGGPVVAMEMHSSSQ